MLGLPTEIVVGDYTSFTDESDLTAQYMVIGGITCGTAFVSELESILARFRQKMPHNVRLEWKNITKHNIGVYADLIDTFCAMNAEHVVDFHALVVDMFAFDHHTHNEGDREVSFDKMLFQSLHAIHKRYPSPERIRCFHGNRDCRYPIENLRTMLNNKVMFQRMGYIWQPYVQVQHLFVKDSLHLQLADLLIGCVGAKWNKRKGYVAGSPKDLIACYFERECPATVLSAKTPSYMTHFDIWKMKSLRA
ncbi:hypothetical protein NKH70_02090 [Mesorhizobium sp. M0991]|uniref:DUF3800 domain-containing protein n=1 Tax=Mesorhizobium sp. M0991 TaxID=2957043 RepID=UPI0033381378